MEIQDILATELAEKFESFCKEVDARATLHLSNYHKEVINKLETMPHLPLSEKRAAYKHAMGIIQKEIATKSKKALTIYFNDNILDGKD